MRFFNQVIMPVAVPFRGQMTVRRLLILLLSCCGLSCAPEESTSLTYHVTRGPFTLSVRSEGTLRAHEAQVLSTPRIRRVRPKVSWICKEGTVVDSGDVVIRLEADEIEQKVLQARDELAMAKADKERTHAEMVLERVMLESQKQSTDAALETARLQMARLSFESASVREQKRLEIDIAELESKKIKRKLQNLETIQQEEMSRLKLKIAQAQNRLTQAQNTLDKLILRAPAEGMVVYERNWMTGEPIKEQDTVFPSMPLIRIPRLTVMDVELKVDETDAQKLQNNQSAWIYPTTRPDIKLPGRVIHVAKVAKPVSRGSRVRKVDVTVQIDSTHGILTAGQSADVEIVLSSVDSVVTVPLDCIFVRDSVRVIYQHRSNGYQPWPVTVLTRGEDFAVVDGDLPTEFDCALMEPDASRRIQP